ncbi:2Fe-2S iron-sulfur cluster-binding protein [Desulfosarcina sp.]|uniref:2Fe-2S iron-sulfur cluster-binding protein n=1 Tax=Desulfosarcina sp. TaxID=2027861 RepID=UPI00397083D8
MPTLKIDNRKIDVPGGTKVIDAAERLGIVIPRFCFHPALGSVGACRVCAVAFTEGPIKGIQMSCMIEAQDGMVVSTTDGEAVDFRRHVIEWLMLHHPHDCPVCDEGGHCLLQDLTVAGGHGQRRYRGRKRTYRNQDLGPLVQHEMNRCIQCYRCSRYYQEFTGYRDLGVMGIGSRVYFGRCTSGVLESPFAGNLIDICPTGVYTDKPSRYLGRRWDYERRASVCIHCSLGCNLTASARYRQVVRHEARPNLAVNGYFICDRGRYGYAYAGAVNRPRQAMATGTPADGGDILAAAREAIQQTAVQYGPGSVAAVTSVRGSLETLAMVTRAGREHGWTGPAVAPTDRQVLNLKTAVDCLRPDLAVSLAADTAAHDVLVIGADPLNESPMLALSLRQVQRYGGHVTVIDPRGVRLPFDFDHWAVHPSAIGAILEALIQEIRGSGAPAPAAAAGFDLIALARRLNGSPHPVVVCGTDVLTSREIALAADLAGTLCRTHKVAGLFYTLAGANAFAAALIGEEALSIEQVLKRIENGSVRMLVAVEADLWSAFPDRARLRAALKRLEHLVVLDYVDTPLNGQADYFVPTQTIYECGGHWINQEGRLQAADAVMAGGEPIEITGRRDHPPRVFDSRIPGGAPMPAWQAMEALVGEVKTTRDATGVLKDALVDFHAAVCLPEAHGQGERIHLDKIDHPSAGTLPPAAEMASSGADIVLLLVDRTFGTEPLSALSPALNQLEVPPWAYLHPETIARLGLKENENVTISSDGGRLTLPVQADPKMAPGVMVVPRHHRLDWQVVGETRILLDSRQIAVDGQ